MKTIKSNTVQYVILEEHEHLKTSHLLSRSGTGWQGQLFLETIKSLSGAWPTGENDPDGHQIFCIPPVDDVIARASTIVDRVVEEMTLKGWMVKMPDVEDLLDDSQGLLGFTRSRDGQTGKDGEALPGQGHPVAANRGRFKA